MNTGRQTWVEPWDLGPLGDPIIHQLDKTHSFLCLYLYVHFTFIDYNEYYDQENENKLMKNESEKLNSMAVTLKELLSRLLEKRKSAKRTKNVDVSWMFSALF